jgi:hypothetical protein
MESEISSQFKSTLNPHLDCFKLFQGVLENMTIPSNLALLVIISRSGVQEPSL